MQPITLEIQDPQIDVEKLKKSLHLKPEAPMPADLEQLIREAQAIAAPKALYKLAFIDDRTEDGLVLDGVRFNSRVLRVNLDPVNRVFPYVVTAGQELQDWASQLKDMMLRFWADSLQEQYLVLARKALVDELETRYQPGSLSSQSPGSLEDWPLSEQPALFKLLGDPDRQIGVRLTGSLLMIPVKSVSGILFASEQSFASCMLCPREDCRNRQAPYDANLYARRYSR